MHPNNRMSLLCLSTFSLALVLTLVGCGEPERPQRTAAIAQPFRFGGDFNEVGKISFFQGESCASQIMFVFHGERSTSVSMSAPFRVSRILTDAANGHKTVHISGKWRRGGTPGCSYVEATQVEFQKSFW
jgi:hypothetical protein